MPRYLTECELGISIPFICNSFLSCLLSALLNIINIDLLTFRESLLVIIYSEICLSSKFIVFIRDGKCGPERKRVVSSEKRRKVKRAEELHMSFMWIRKSNGPSTDP
jgi:hypothetical protein